LNPLPWRGPPDEPQGCDQIHQQTGADDYLKERGVTLLGGGMDESPQAYKPIEAIIAAQHEPGGCDRKIHAAHCPHGG
jgi:hypothetical protein